MVIGPVRSARRVKSPKLVMIFAPKGGVGKTTIALNLAVAAAAAGYKVAGIDFDPQHHFALWATDREARKDHDSFVKVPVMRGHLRQWREQLKELPEYDLVFVDTPPRAEAEGNVRLDLQEIGMHSDFIIMPVEVSGSAMRFVVQFMSWWKSSPGRAVFVINKAIAGRTILRDARETLQAYGPCWEGSIPMRDDITRQVDYGLAALDGEDFQGRDSYLALWRFCADRIGVKP
jgi:chromosome partitioning protein